MIAETDYTHILNQSIAKLFRDALKLGMRNPAMARFLYKTVRWQHRAARIRGSWEERGVRVPAFMIASITRRCNLQCKGCYARAQHRGDEPEMSPAKLAEVIAEAREIGISIILIAGGEPLTRPEILRIAADNPQIVFPLFTNGLLIDDDVIETLKRCRNVVPVLSLEGRQGDTDERRGAGIHAHLERTMAKMKAADIFFGTSITLTRENFYSVTAKTFVNDLLEAGSRLVFFIDYVPVEPGTDHLVLTDRQLAEERGIILGLQAELPGLFISFPGGEEALGGCLAAGRGFVHVSSEGRVEPCPFSPFSDASLNEMTLIEALQSDLLRVIRENRDLLEEGNGGCALWENRDWVASLVAAPVMCAD